MASCIDFEPLLAERASGALSPTDAARLDAHLAACERCRAELAAYQQALGLAKLPAPTDDDRRALSQLAPRVRADLDRAPVGKVFGRLLGLAAVAAAITVLIANKVILPGAERRAAERAAAAAKWQVPDPDELLSRIEKDHPELAVGDENGLSRAEKLADAAYLKAVGGTE